MKQGALFEKLPRHIELTCANGEPWEGPHPLCEAESDRACERFTEAVKAGTWDEAGYTPNERRPRRQEHKGASHAEKQ